MPVRTSVNEKKQSLHLTQLVSKTGLRMTHATCVCVLTGSFRGIGAFYYEIEETSFRQHY